MVTVNIPALTSTIGLIQNTTVAQCIHHYLKQRTMNLGKPIKEIRKNRGMSQVVLAKRCGISQTSLSQIESGEVVPTKKTLLKIAVRLHTQTYKES